MKNKIELHHILETIKKLLLLNGIYWILMSLYRLFFFCFYANFKDSQLFSVDLIEAFILGARFDLAIIAYVNSLVTLSMLIMWGIKRKDYFKKWLRCLRSYYSIMYTAVFFVFISDFAFYLYFKRHIDTTIFGIFEDNTKVFLLTAVKNYPIFSVTAGFCVFVYGLYRISRYFISRIQIDNSEPKSYSLQARIIIVFVIVLLNAMAARGSFGIYPLGVGDTAISLNPFINKLSITGLHMLQQTIKYRMRDGKEYSLIKEMGYEGRIEDAFSDFLGIEKEKLDKEDLLANLVKRTKKSRTIEDIRPNVVVIVMEGFGADLARYNSESFNVLGELAKHYKEDYYFSNFISGDIGTIGSIETILYNLPRRSNCKALTQTKYAYKTYLNNAAVPYKNAGYETMFLYGGNAGWRNVASIIKQLGIDYIDGDGTMPKEYLRNEWAVYDEYLFEHLFRKLSEKSGKPKFALLLTTSNHPPYSVPDTYTKLPLIYPEDMKKRLTGNKKLTRLRFETYQYAADSAGRLMSRIKDSELADNTIVVITGDHNFWDVFDYSTEESMYHYSVPCYMYIPEKLKPAKVDVNRYATTVDIIPTLYNLSLSGREYMSMGKDLMDPSSPDMAFNVNGFTISKEGAVFYRKEADSLPDDSLAKSEPSYIWANPDSKLLIRSDNSELPEFRSKNMLYYKSSIAITEYIIKKPSNAN